MNRWPIHVVRVVEKVWGREFWVVNTDNYCMKILHVEPGRACSLHVHNIKDETFYVEEGQCHIQIGDRCRPLQPGDSVRIFPGTMHRFWVSKALPETCVIIEVSTHHDDNDVYRLEESRILK